MLGTTAQSVPEDMIYNWRNELRQSNTGEQLVAAKTAQDYKRRGFNSSETLEMLASQGYAIKTAEAVINSVFNPSTDGNKTASKTQQIAPVVPTSYQEVSSIIEETLSKLSAREFINKLAKSEEPILRVSKKSLESFYRLAENAKQDNYALSVLHNELKPFIEEAMLSSVLIAERTEGRVSKASTDGSKYKVATAKEIAEVNLSNGTSTGSRFQRGCFADFGLADEHLVRVADTVSPHERLKRALGS